MINTAGISIIGHVKIWDPDTKEVFVDKNNAINEETISIVIANLLSNSSKSHIYEMHFGNGGCIIDDTGNITYKDVTVNLQAGTLAGLYSPVYFKNVDSSDTLNNLDPEYNNVKMQHTVGLSYSDVVITCTLKNSDPGVGEIESNGNLVKNTVVGDMLFNEIGLKSRGPDAFNSGYLLSHIVFEPVQKNISRVIQVVYTLRISLF